MIIRFMMFWALLSSFFGVWIYSLSKTDKKKAKKMLFRGVVSTVIAGVVIVMLMFLNNISGV